MSLEEDIRQNKFSSEFEKAGINIMATSSWIHQQTANRLKPLGITPEQFNVLRILRGSHPKALRLSDISCRMIDKSSNATRLVEKLRQKGMVSRVVCENNRRQVDITITDLGLKTLSHIDKLEQEWLSVLNKISANEAQELNRILDKLRS